MSSIVTEQAALTIQLLLTTVHVDDMFQLEEFLKNLRSNHIALVLVDVWHDVATPAFDQICCR